MNSNNPIDDLFRSGIGNHTEAPPAAIWGAVEKKMTRRNLLRKGIYLSSGLIIITCITFMLLHLLKEQPNSTAHIPTLSQPEQQHTATSQQNEQETNKNASVNSSSNTDLSNAKEPTVTSQAYHNNRTSSSVHPNVSSVPQATSVNETEPVTEATSISEANTVIPQIVDNSTTENTNTNQVDVIPPQTGTNDIKPDVATDVNPVTETPERAINNDETKPVETPDQTNTPLAESPSVDEAKITDDVSPNMPPAVTPPNKKSIKPTFEALVYVMPSFAKRSFAGLGEAETAFRNNNENNIWFINYGAECRMNMGGMFVQSGLMLSQAGEKNNYNSKFFNGLDTTGSHYNVFTVSYPDPQDSNNTIIAFDSTWVHQTDSSFSEVSLNSVNQIRYIEIPLTIGYQFQTGPHSLGLSGGMSLALLSNARMTLVDAQSLETETFDHSEGKLSKMIWLYQASLHYAYSLSDNTGLFVQGTYRKQLNSIYSNKPYEQKYYFYDIKAGVIFKF